MFCTFMSIIYHNFLTLGNMFTIRITTLYCRFNLSFFFLVLVRKEGNPWKPPVLIFIMVVDLE